MSEIQLYNGVVTLVDDEMLTMLSQWKWGFDGRYAYRRQHLRMEGKKQIYKKIYLQKLINQTPDGMDTDHINGNKLDNRKCNLRSVTRSQNNANQPKYPGKFSSKYKGVCWHKLRGKWKAEYKFEGKKKHLGLFDNEEDAAKAYDAAITQHLGGFVQTNF